MKHIMLDLETMGNGYSAAIVAIGACEFNPRISDMPGQKFYCQVALADSVAAGLVMDPSTVLWWMEQSDAARKSTFGGNNRLPLGDALFRFSNWIQDEDAAVWGNGATFDNVVIRSAYKAVGLPIPWSFRNDRCYRTVRELLPEDKQPVFEDYGVKHNALDDAIAQALHLQKVFKVLGLSDEPSLVTAGSVGASEVSNG